MDMVLSDLLERADQRAGELAEGYVRVRVVGLICEGIMAVRLQRGILVSTDRTVINILCCLSSVWKYHVDVVMA
jgi:hypothetical protein